MLSYTLSSQGEHIYDMKPSEFSFRFTALILTGYLLATVPQTFLDPLLLHHVQYGARHYEYAWVICPLSVLLVVTTMLLSQERFLKKSLIFPVAPFVIIAISSIPIFKPELPHGNLIFVSILWSAVAFIMAWLHKVPIINPYEFSPKTALDAQIAFAKEQSTFWRTLFLGLFASYFAILVGVTKEVHSYNYTIVGQNDSEIFLLNSYGNIHIFLLSLFILIGPALELSRKYLSSNNMFLKMDKNREET